MPICFICKLHFSHPTHSFLSISLLCKHFQIKHSDYNFTFYDCAEVNCLRSFHLLNSLKKHLASHISVEEISTQTQHINSNCVTNSLPEQSDKNIINTSLDNMSSILPESIPIPGTDNCVSVNVDNFLASLYANPQVPRNVVQTVVKDVKNIFSDVHQTLKKNINKLLLEGNISHESFNHFNNTLEVLEEPFTDLCTEYKRIKYFTELGTYIAPCEYVIGERLNAQIKKNNFHSLVPVNSTVRNNLFH